MAKNAHGALKTLSKKAVHPSVKANAKTVLRKSGRYIGKTFGNSLLDTTATTVFGYGIGKVAEFYY